jgi:nucleotide-binding universal stress UspA family protein
MIVAMAIITTMAMPPTLRWALARLPMRKEEKQRLEREEMEARGFVPNLERLLLAIDDSDNGKFASRIAGLLAGTRSMPTTVLHIGDASKVEAKKTDEKPAPKNRKARGMAVEQKDDVKKSESNGSDTKAAASEKSDEVKERESEKQAEKAGEAVKEAAEQTKSKQKKDEKSDSAVDITTIVHEAPTADVIAEEAEKGYDLMIIGLEKSSTRSKEFHESVTGLAMGFDGPLAIADARGELLHKPDDKLNILVPVNGTESSRRGAEVAITIARATKAPLTVLYVAVGNKRGSRRGIRTRRHEEAILKDIVAIADGYNMSIRTAVLVDKAAHEAILAEMKRRKNNMVILGVGRRPGEKLFFGDTAASLLQDAECSLLFVAS